MRFFTLEIYHAFDRSVDGDEGLLELTTALHSYQQHVETLTAILGPHLFTLSGAFLIDDALVARAKLDTVNGTLEPTLRCGNLQVGYFDVALRYEDVEIDPRDVMTLSQVARGTKSHRRFDFDAYAHELDVTEGGRIEHSILFHPGVEFTLRCRRLTWTRTDRRDRQLPRLKDRFVVS